LTSFAALLTADFTSTSTTYKLEGSFTSASWLKEFSSFEEASLKDFIFTDIFSSNSLKFDEVMQFSKFDSI
jgi:hypothetical protein